MTAAQRRRVILGVGAGNALEWYDWTAYSIFAAYFAKQFFHSEDPLAALLGTLAVFAVGFFMRPLGGIFFGWLAGGPQRATFHHDLVHAGDSLGQSGDWYCSYL